MPQDVIYLVDVWAKGAFNVGKPMRKAICYYKEFDATSMNAREIPWSSLSFSSPGNPDPKSLQWEGYMFDVQASNGSPIHFCIIPGADYLRETDLVGANSKWLAVGYAGTFVKNLTWGPIVPIRRDFKDTLLVIDSREGVQYHVKYYVTGASPPDPPKADLCKEPCSSCGQTCRGRSLVAADDSTGQEETDEERAGRFEEAGEGVVDALYGGEPAGAMFVSSEIPPQDTFTNLEVPPAEAAEDTATGTTSTT